MSKKVQAVFEFVVAPLLIGIIIWVLSSGLSDRISATEQKQKTFEEKVTGMQVDLLIIRCRLKDDFACEKLKLPQQ